MDFWLVDAFASRRFAGNPAAVFLGRDFPPDDEIHGLVRELNQPAVVFVRPAGDAFDLRWFTPAESDLCGHGTLAAAHVLAEASFDPPFHFRSRGGPLTATGAAGVFALDFPALPVGERAPSPELAEALGAPIVWLGGDRARTLVQLRDAASVRTLAPDLRRLAVLEPRGVIVTAAGDRGYDVVSRYFKPYAGIDEDPVTGSAHCALAPFWAARLGKPELACHQASARGGELGVRLVGDRVQLEGRAVTVLRGRRA